MAWHQAITWTSAVSRKKFQEHMIIHYTTFSVKKMHFKMLSAVWQPWCSGLNVLMEIIPILSVQDWLGYHIVYAMYMYIDRMLLAGLPRAPKD